MVPFRDSLNLWLRVVMGNPPPPKRGRHFERGVALREESLNMAGVLGARWGISSLRLQEDVFACFD